jgi:lactobin A/cerein 7B family class IIb bacteriocin
MVLLSDNELKNVTGGFGFAGICGIAACIVFLIGVFDGYTRPLKCN